MLCKNFQSWLQGKVCESTFLHGHNMDRKQVMTKLSLADRISNISVHAQG